MSRFVYLPPELVQYIFSLASAASRHAGRSICLVASWARRIALPHLLHTVVIKDHLANIQFRHHFQGPTYNPGLGSPALPLIRNVWMEAVSDRIISFFNACDNIQHLALVDEAFLWLIHSSSPTAAADRFNRKIPALALVRDQDLHLTMISARRNWIRREYISNVTMRSPLLSKITHIVFAEIAAFPVASDLQSFTRLTHLAVPFYKGIEDGLRLPSLLAVPSLQMLVVVIVTSDVEEEDRTCIEDRVADLRKIDRRIYLAESRYRGVGIQEPWEEEVRGGESIWDKAIRYTRKYEASGPPMYVRDTSDVAVTPGTEQSTIAMNERPRYITRNRDDRASIGITYGIAVTARSTQLMTSFLFALHISTALLYTYPHSSHKSYRVSRSAFGRLHRSGLSYSSYSMRVMRPEAHSESWITLGGTDMLIRCAKSRIGRPAQVSNSKTLLESSGLGDLGEELCAIVNSLSIQMVYAKHRCDDQGNQPEFDYGDFKLDRPKEWLRV